MMILKMRVVEYSTERRLSECITVRILQENSVSPYITIYMAERAGFEPAVPVKGTLV